MGKWNSTIPLHWKWIGLSCTIWTPFDSNKFRDIRAGAWTTTKMADELIGPLDVLADDDYENDFFGDEKDDLILFPACSMHICKEKFKSNAGLF